MAKYSNTTRHQNLWKLGSVFGFHSFFHIMALKPGILAMIEGYSVD